FGSNESDPNNVERGPRFVKQPSHVVVGTVKLPVTLECVAQGRPQPTYEWLKVSESKKPSLVSRDNRVTITNGKLIIHSPLAARDAGRYQCVASNKLGSILSDPGTVTFGHISDFSNDVPGVVSTNLFQGSVLTCDLPNFHPGKEIRLFRKHRGLLRNMCDDLWAASCLFIALCLSAEPE
ncbi:contactin, partial [Plakobranchus ocellatus]